MKRTLERIANRFVSIAYDDLTSLEKTVLSLATKELGWRVTLNQSGEIESFEE